MIISEYSIDSQLLYQQSQRTRHLDSLHVYTQKKDKKIITPAKYKSFDDCCNQIKASIHEFDKLFQNCQHKNEEDVLITTYNSYFNLFCHSQYYSDTININRFEYFNKLLMDNGFIIKPAKKIDDDMSSVIENIKDNLEDLLQIKTKEQNFTDDLKIDPEISIESQLENKYPSIYTRASFLNILNTCKKDEKILTNLIKYKSILCDNEEYMKLFNIIKMTHCNEKDESIIQTFIDHNYKCKILTSPKCKIVAIKLLMRHYDINLLDLNKEDIKIKLLPEHTSIIHSMFDYRGKVILTRWQLVKFIKTQINNNISNQLILSTSNSIRTNNKISNNTSYKFDIDVLKTHLELNYITSGLCDTDIIYLNACNLTKKIKDNSYVCDTSFLD